MLGKTLTIAVLLAATLAVPQAQAGSAFSTTIVIGSIPTSLIARQGGYRHGGFAQQDKRDHFAGRPHPRWHAAPPRRYLHGHHRPRRHVAHRHGNLRGHARR